jgi:hypothetical protein
MSKASSARAARKAAAKDAPANENAAPQVDIMKATPEQLRQALLEAHNTIAVMRDEATLAATQLTQARAVMRQQGAAIQMLQKRLGGTPPKKKK